MKYISAESIKLLTTISTLNSTPSLFSPESSATTELKSEVIASNWRSSISDSLVSISSLVVFDSLKYMMDKSIATSRLTLILLEKDKRQSVLRLDSNIKKTGLFYNNRGFL